MSQHTCHVPGYQSEVPPEKLMCYRHWNMVPERLKDLVMKHYRLGQCDDKQPSTEWINAARAAITAVQQKEKP